MSAVVDVKLPAELVWELWKRAERRDGKVADVIVDALRFVDNPPTVKKSRTLTATHEKVRELVADGWADGQIAVQLDRTRAYVAEVRRRFGLMPNKRKVTV